MNDERGFSLMEAIVASVIAVIAVMGMAYSFGLGRAWINRFEIVRMADGQAQSRMELLSTLPPSDVNLTLGDHAGAPFNYLGTAIGDDHWRVEAPDVTVPGRGALHQVTVTVAWTNAGLRDSLAYQRLFPIP